MPALGLRRLARQTVWLYNLQIFSTLLLLVILTLVMPRLAYSVSETAILEIFLNEQRKGEYFVQLSESGDILIEATDLENLGLILAPREASSAEGSSLISLSRVAGISFKLDEASLTLHLTASIDLLLERSINLATVRKKKIYYPQDTSAFLNYGLDFQSGSSNEDQFFSISNQLGIRRDEFLFQAETLYSQAPEESSFIRLMTRLVREQRASLRRWTFGDFLTPANNLSGSIQMGGFSFAKNYRIDPYNINYPTLTFSGSAIAPSDVEVYLDGNRIYSGQVEPGRFELTNIARFRGAGALEVVLRDPYGHEERISHPFYLSDRLIKKGLHSYSYNFGVERENFGSQSFDYGEPVLMAVHEYGYTNRLNIGGTIEAGKGIFNLAPQASLLWGNLGEINATLAGHWGEEGNGLAAKTAYLIAHRKADFDLTLAYYSQNFSTLATLDSETRPQVEASAGASYHAQKLGSISLSMSTISYHNDPSDQTLLLSYTRNLRPNLSFTSFFSKKFGNDDESRIFVGLNFHPRRDLLLSTQLELGSEGSTQSIQLQRNSPSGEGYGYRALAEHTNDNNENLTSLNASGEYRSRYGIYRGELWNDWGSTQSSLKSRLSAAGSLAYVGNTLSLTRPIDDSFGLVKIGDLEGVRVYHNSQEIGRTDKNGKVFVPAFTSYYENQISINDKDVPLEYTLGQITRHISPPLRSGSCISFNAIKSQPVTGRLVMVAQEREIPLEFIKVHLWGNDRKWILPTGHGGEFYIDPAEKSIGEEVSPNEEIGCREPTIISGQTVAQKTFHGELTFEEQTFRFDLHLPDTEELFIDLGKIVVNTLPNNANDRSFQGDKKTLPEGDKTR